MSSDLRLYVLKYDYDQAAQPGWPSYEDYVTGVQAADTNMQGGIDSWTKMWVGSGVRFPIRTKTSCQSKWTWSAIYLNQLSTASCHRVKPIKFSIEEFDDFHNIPQKLEDRRQMLKGEWPLGDEQWPHGGCESCKYVEDAGGFSDRMHNNGIRDLTPPEVLTDFEAVKVTPQIVELFAQNTCNLSCMYCNANLSSKIEQENAKFGEFKQGGIRIPVVKVPEATKEYFERFLSWLDNNIQNITRLHLLGGETFLQHDLMNSVLDIIERRPNPRLQFCVFSNCNVPDRIWNDYTSRIKALKLNGNMEHFDLTVSIDCWGPQAEYTRSGLDLSKLEERLSWASEQDWLRLNINQTVTATTVKTMPELIEKINYYSELNNKQIGHYFQFFTSPANWMFQHPNIFGYEQWSGDFERIFSVMKDDDSYHHKDARRRMTGLMKQLQQVKDNNWVEIKKLQTYLDELDRRRGTNWRPLFPHIDIHEPT